MSYSPNKEVPRFQPADSNLCGQTCIAMLLGLTLKEAIKLVGKRGRTRTSDLVKAIRKDGRLRCGDRRSKHKAGTPLPDYAILNIRYGKKDTRTHWVLRVNGVNKDPSPENYLVQLGQSLENSRLDQNWLAGEVTSYLLLYETHE